ncbi:hypothetical protein MA16_Dca020662 [Dendrobium catenatum]|uniref:Uncharacterized protein n=1 Tax=Dendrobium catenatum TaxID=906689 RepID=A0A2I0XG72_9ASPA|nr:hypothetical protein MA16_Dca020662 [Dendrobium catenatum]
MVHVRASNEDGGASSVVSNQGVGVALMKSAGQGTISNEALDVELNFEMVDRAVSLQDSLDLDGVMEIMGGSETEEILKELNDRTALVDQLRENRDAENSDTQRAMAVETEHGGMLDQKEKIVQDSIYRVEVSRIVDNPMFETNKIMFTLCNESCMGDLGNVSSGCKVQKTGMDT